MGDTTLIVIFVVTIAGCLFVDLGILNKKGKTPSFRSALAWTGFWAGLALAFCGGIWWRMGQESAVTFLTAWVVEQSLSIDNLFVFLLIFASFKTPSHLQHRVLFWGIIGALALRAVCIGVGVVALQRFGWLSYVFGAILIWGGIKTGLKRDDADEDLMESRMVRFARKLFPITPRYDGDRFFTRENGKLYGTPLFLTLLVVEASDLVFAVDSIPAVLAITTDPFIVYTSNVFAILGLRSIFFALAHMMQYFHYLKYALAAILIFVGVKIAAQHHYHVPVTVTLCVIGGLLVAAVIASLLRRKPAAGS